MKVVVVESPAKAKTINKYLGSDYKVVASYGHVRDLPAKDGSVLPDADFAMSWEVDGKSEKHLKTILEAVRGADRLFLATDPDREGEAISWHVSEVLNSRRGLKHLVGGMCETDYSGYPDCRDDSLKALQVTLSLGMDRRVVIHTPLMWRDSTGWHL